MTTPHGTTRRANGDRAGLIAAHDAYAADLYDYCRWALDDPAAAENAVHGALLAAAGQPGLFGEPERLRPWLYAAARKECLRAARRIGGPRFIGSAAGGDEPATSPQARRQLSLARRAAAQLGPRDREIAELALRHGLSATELAAILGTSTASMRAAIHRISTELSAICGDDAQQLFFAWHREAAPAALAGRVTRLGGHPERIAYFAQPGQARPAEPASPPPCQPAARASRRWRPAFGLTVLALGTTMLASEPTERVALNPVLNPAPAPSGNVSLDIAAPLGGTPSTRAAAPTPTAGRAGSAATPNSPRAHRRRAPSSDRRPATTAGRQPATGTSHRPQPAPKPGNGSTLSGSRSLQSANYPTGTSATPTTSAGSIPSRRPAPRSPNRTPPSRSWRDWRTGAATPSRGTGGRYLRHYSFRLRLHADNGTPLFRQDATFCARTGSTTGTVSLESYNYPGRFIRHRNFELWVDPADNTERFRADSAFRACPPGRPDPSPGRSRKPSGGGIGPTDRTAKISAHLLKVTKQSGNLVASC